MVAAREHDVKIWSRREDVAEAILFLCSPEAKAITGVTLAVDCGFLVANTYNTYPK